MAGQADPPQMSFSTVSSRSSVARRCVSRPIHTVGTPADIVTRSLFSRLARLAPSIWRPGMTRLAPTIGAAYGIPQALT